MSAERQHNPESRPPATFVGHTPPTELTRFIGRADQLEGVRRLILENRLVTLTGAGGIGKSRIALELLRSLQEEMAIAWVDLSGVAEGGLLTPFVARAFGGREVFSVDGLVDVLPGGPLLLCLDGCEHLVDASAELGERILALRSDVRILTTSREALGVRGERAWLVPPLTVPPPPGAAGSQAFGSADSIDLFLDRARDVVPDFALTPANGPAIAEICRRLDGIPLALEIAAARVKVLTPQQIRDRLDDMFEILSPSVRRSIPRHRTLSAAIEWTYDLLPEPSRRVFRRVSVFRGGFDLEAAEAVASSHEISAAEVLEQLAVLVDRSLVTVREVDGISRYYLLEPIRQYAAAESAQADELDELSRRHAGWYLERVEEAGPHLLTQRRPRWVRELDPEMHNLQAALGWTRLLAPELHVRLCGSMWWLWVAWGNWVEARSVLERALELEASRSEGMDRARLLFAAGTLDALQARPDIARARLTEVVALAETHGDAHLLAYGRTYLGLALVQVGRGEGEEPLALAREWFEASADLYGLRLTLILLGNHRASLGDIEGALEMTRAGVEAARRFGLPRELAIAVETLAILHVRNGSLAEAEPLLLEALEALLEEWAPMFVARALQFLGLIRGREDRLREAGRLIGAAEALRALTGSPPFQVEAVLLDEASREFGSGSGAEEFEAGIAEGRAADARDLVRRVVASAPIGDGSMEAAVSVPSASPSAGGEGLPVSAPSVHTAAPALVHDLRVLALGPLEIHLAGERVTEVQWPFSKPRELLLFLLLRREGWSRDELSGALWPGSSPAQLKNSFHVALHHLRKALGDPSWVVIEGTRYRLSPDRSIYFDLEEFEARAGHALAVPEPDRLDEEALRDILALYRGPFAADQVPVRWHDDPSSRAGALRREVGLALGRVLEEGGRHNEATAVYRDIALEDELHEDVQRRYMLALARSGQRAEALKHYERLSALLARELDAEPEGTTKLLWQRIRAGETDLQPML